MEWDWEEELKAAEPAVPLQTRYERLVRHVLPAYLDRNRMTYSGLAALVGVERTTLSRFINGAPGHVPTKDRPVRVALLEKLERVCSQLYVISWDAFGTDTIPDGPDGDYEIWFRNYTERLKQLQSLSAVRGLGLVPEMYAQAMQAPAPWGASMASNLTLMILALVVKDEARDASPTLLRYTVERVRKLKQRALEVATENFARDYLHWPIGYAGASLIRLGELLGDDGAIEEGVEGCLDAVGRPHREQDEHWHNLLEALERLFVAGHPRRDEWSTRVALFGEKQTTDLLVRAHYRFDYPHVRAHWSRVVPALSRRIADMRATGPHDDS